MDDGSQSIEESLDMLRESKRQGVSGIAATPHFYADATTPDRFIEKRKSSLGELMRHLDHGMPQIRLGAEVHYYEGICRSDEILKLRMEGTNLLLVEMPVMRWTPRMQDVLVELNHRPEVTVLLAHMERYLFCQSPNTWNILYRNGILMQANASFFLQRKTRRKALGLLRSGGIHVLGSDCHNMRDRCPCMGNAMALIVRSLGGETLDALTAKEEIPLYEQVDAVCI